MPNRNSEIAQVNHPPFLMDGALLEKKLIGDIVGQFYVPKYQRGYRWKAEDVKRLLDDLWDNIENNNNDKNEYSLQPIVLKKRLDNEWELVDGQQRLTTIYLLLAYMKRNGLQNVGPMYNICYETRPDSADYLQKLGTDEAKQLFDKNIDYFHMYKAWECIDEWFSSYNVGKRQQCANRLYNSFFENINIIWYEAPESIDSIELFTRLNVGRIPLTDAELVKAYLLSLLAKDHYSRASALSAAWDSIEQDLRHPNVWSFVTTAVPENYPTRITLLLDAVADAIVADSGHNIPQLRPQYFTFETIRKRIEKNCSGNILDNVRHVWDQVINLHGLLMGWYENRDLYHKIGYLVTTGHIFRNLVILAKDSKKSAFEAVLDEQIRLSLNLSRTELSKLNYTKSDDLCFKVLLLMNVETVRTSANSLELYPFLRHQNRYGRDGLKWSLEHIHAQEAERLSKKEQWVSWLESHRDALEAMPSIKIQKREELIDKINKVISNINKIKFEDLANEIFEFFSDVDTEDSMHSITNLALLPSDANSKLSNSVFEVKRRFIRELEKKGTYIPICTHRIFLKYYTDADSQQIHFWSRQDREGYFNAMLEKLDKYLKRESDDE
jgi:hypothetical protein